MILPKDSHDMVHIYDFIDFVGNTGMPNIVLEALNKALDDFEEQYKLDREEV